MVSILILAAALISAVLSQNAFIENPGDGSVTLGSAPGKDVVLDPGDGGSLSLNGVSFSQKELQYLKQILNGQRPQASIGNALAPGSSGITVVGSNVYVGSTKTVFTSPQVYTVQEAVVGGKRIWSPSTLSIQSGDMISWKWSNQESVIETDALGTAIDGGISSGAQPVLGGTFNYTFLEASSTRYFGSRNTPTMLFNLTVSSVNFDRNSFQFANLSITADVIVLGRVISPSIDRQISQRIQGLNATITAALSGVWGSPGRTDLRDFWYQTFEIVTSSQTDYGWRCRDPYASCPSGKTMYHGGCTTSCHGSDSDQGIAESYPEGNGWRCRGYNYYPSYAYAFCV